MTEQYEHDTCCGIDSLPAEGIKDQSLRSCPKCDALWFEDLRVPPSHHTPSDPDRAPEQLAAFVTHVRAIVGSNQ